MSGPAPSPSQAEPAAPEIVLIIDDNEENRYTFGRYLRQEGFEIQTAPTGFQGLERARSQPLPSLIMLDIQLPDTSGYELCRVLKDDPLTASIPVLHTSATYTESGDRVYGLQGGADGYLTQPIDSRELVATVHALLRVRAAEQTARGYAAQWKAAFDAIRDAVCLVAPAGRIERFNRAFAALLPTTFVRTGDDFAALTAHLGGDFPLAEAQVGSRTELLVGGRWHRVANDPVVDESGHPAGTVWVFSDIHSIREAERKLQDMNQELERRVSERTASLREAIHQMEQFSYTVSHDLRAPLRAMQGYSSALLEDYAGKLDEEALGYLRRIAKNAERLDRMIIDVLTFTRVSRETPILVPIGLARLLHDVVEHFPGLQPPRARLRIDVPPGLHVLAHESGLSQALSNLLGNAAKFVAPGVTPEIVVRSEEGDGFVRLWVEDNGIGIAPEYQGRLFGMFERVLPANQYEGTGVGLAITRKAIERMGGRVGMQSDGKTGSRFWIELQRTDARETRERAA